METKGISGEEYTPGYVWSLLIGEVEDVDPDEMIDLGVGIRRLDRSQQTFLTLLHQGYPASVAIKAAGVTENQTRYMSKALMALTEAMNNGEKAA